VEIHYYNYLGLWLQSLEAGAVLAKLQLFVQRGVHLTCGRRRAGRVLQRLLPPRRAVGHSVRDAIRYSVCAVGAAIWHCALGNIVTLWTLYRSYFNGISVNLQVYSVTCCAVTLRTRVSLAT
jgi:hypothetical protein